MNAILQRLGEIGIIPVVVIDNEADASPLAEALLEGGLPTMEVTFRTDAAKNAIELIERQYPSMLLGAGTVLTVDQVNAAIGAGAKYIVSPGLNSKIVDYCLKKGVTVTPGVITPTEIQTAIEWGLEVVKFFPAESSGGLPYLKAVSAPFRQIRFIPTGGLDAGNVVAYLRFPKVLACGGSWMVKSDHVSGRRFEEIRSLAAEAVALRRSAVS